MTLWAILRSLKLSQKTIEEWNKFIKCNGTKVSFSIYRDYINKRDSALLIWHSMYSNLSARIGHKDAFRLWLRLGHKN